MTYVLNIDWLALFCMYKPTGLEQWSPEEEMIGDLFHGNFKIKLMQCGTRQFSKLWNISIPNEEDGGWEDFAEVQSHPYDGNVLPKQAIIIRFVNRVLYMDEIWDLVADFLGTCRFEFVGISRIDICADFNQFATIDPIALIEGFASTKFRHIGRGVGALYFNHEVRKKKYGVHYTGLSFGTHASDARVYLYNKSFELLVEKDKPYIKDHWKQAGLDAASVWRLEISIKSKATRFHDRKTKKDITIDTKQVANADGLDMIFHTFVRKLFSFVKNHPHITNISREPRLILFDDSAPFFDRCIIRNASCSSRMERILIKALYQLADRYRGTNIKDIELLSQTFAMELAESTGLNGWMSQKVGLWEKPNHK